MRIVVTGASGNIGTAVVRRLLERGDTVVGISRRRPPLVPPYRDADWVTADLGAPTAAQVLQPALAGADAVVHLAWLIQPSRDRELLRRVNVGGLRAVLDAVRAAQVPHLVHVSSIGAYSPAPGTVKDESWPTGGVPGSSYSEDKAACERLLDGVDDLLVARVRPTLVLQPQAATEITRYFLGSLVPRSLLRPGLLRFAPLPKSFAVQFVHTDDVADAVARILAARASGAFNLAADPIIDRARFAEVFGGVGPPMPVGALKALAEASYRARLQPTDGGWVEMGFKLPNIASDRARAELGWQPQHAADQVLADFVRALRRGTDGPGPLLGRRRH